MVEKTLYQNLGGNVMKKYLSLALTLALTLSMLFAVAVPASAEVTDTFALKRLPGAYAVGEVLNVDGDCGGYNLQFAWSSAYVAAMDMAKKL